MILVLALALVIGCTTENRIVDVEETPINVMAKEMQDCNSQDLKSNCQDGVLLAHAIDLDDTTYCNVASNAISTEKCLEGYYIMKARRTSNLAFCDFIENQLSREICLRSNEWN